MKTKIIYEDQDILVCVKPVGFAVQTAVVTQMDMVSELKNYLSVKGSGKQPYVGIVHRLDQPVSGLIVFAKTPQAAANLSNQIQKHEMTKIYHASVAGKLPGSSGDLVHWLGKEAGSNRTVVLKEKDRSQSSMKLQKAELHYRELAVTTTQKGTYTDIEIVLLTGRHHQIRAQFAAIGCPLLGDLKYSNAESVAISALLMIKSVKLCAYQLEFRHPSSKKHMKFVLPEET